MMMMMPFIVLAETKHDLRPYTRPTSTPLNPYAPGLNSSGT
jgi:hypothetical protein